MNTISVQVVNWSYILKYLLATTSKLRSQLAEEQQRYSSSLHNNSPEKGISPRVGNGGSDEGNLDGDKDRNRLRVSSDDGEEDDEQFLVPPRAPVQANVDARNGTFSSHNTGSQRKAERSDSNGDSDDPSLSIKRQERSPEQDYHLRNIAAANSDSRSSNHGMREERKRLSQAGKLGPRLQNSRPAVTHNAATYSEIDQIGPPPSTPYKDNDDDSDAAGSFRSAATVNSIPPYPHGRSSAEPSKYQKDGGRRPHRREHDILPSQPAPSSTNFAQDVVQGLGVVGPEAEAAMTVIERVSRMTSTDIAKLDAETRQQVMQIRLELGIMDADDKLPRPPLPPAPRSSGDYYRSSLPTGMYTPSVAASNITMSDEDDDDFSQLGDDDDWR